MRLERAIRAYEMVSPAEVAALGPMNALWKDEAWCPMLGVLGAEAASTGVLDTLSLKVAQLHASAGLVEQVLLSDQILEMSI